jgi:hypothetical protein
MADAGCIQMPGFEGWQMGNSIETTWSDCTLNLYAIHVASARYIHPI